MRIVFSCPMARPTFETTSIDAPFGGSEVRAALFARGLAALGCDVHVLVDAHGRQTTRRAGPVTLHYRSLPTPLKRSRDLPSVWQRWLYAPYLAAQRSWRSIQKRSVAPPACPDCDATLARIDGDLYASLGVHEHSANVVATAAQRQRPSLLFLASDTDLCEAYCRDSSERNAYGQRVAICRYVLDKATHIVAQTRQQQIMLLNRFGRESTVIRNPIDLNEIRHLSTATTATYDVLWLGRADRFSKRADLALQLAAECPAARFLVVMNPRDPAVYDELSRSAPSNAEVRPTLSRDEVPSVMARCRLLVNTSDAEGFPNTFLQAAQLGLPILSLHVDPDGMLSNYNCGVCAAGDWQRLVSEVQRRVANRQLPVGSAAGPKYVRTFHRAEDRCAELYRLIGNVVSAYANSPNPGRNAA